MAISEEARHRLYSRLEAVLGHEDASTLMEHLPPVGWADVATKRDLDHQSTAFRGEIAVWGAELRGEMSALGSDLRSEMAALRADMGAQGAGLRVEIARSSAETKAGLRTLFLGLAGLQMSGAGLALAITRLG